jgi:tetratricopeptide (TPR) repeat protein
LASVKTVDPEVYKAYLKGRYYAGKWTNKDLWQAVRHFQEALDLDPTYAPAWAGIGTCYEYLGSFASGADLSRENARVRAKAALARAVELDPTLREPHQALGGMKLDEWDWEGATREFQRARELDPGFAPSRYLLRSGRFDDAVAAARRGAELNPLGYDTQLNLGLTYFMAGHFDESIAQLKKVILLDPGIHHAHYELAWSYAKKGEYKEATAECETSLAIVRKRQPETFAAQGCGWVDAMAGRRREALEIAHNLETMQAGDDRSIQLAHIYDALGDSNRALAFLSKAYEERADNLPNQWYTPLISDRLRADPRFQELIRRTGIPWATFPPPATSLASARAEPHK